MKPRTYRPPSSTTTQNWDPATWIALKRLTTAESHPSIELTVYQLVLWALENKPVADNAPSAPDHTTVDTSSFAAFRQRDEREATGKL
jgi:hypothetical protein